MLRSSILLASLLFLYSIGTFGQKNKKAPSKYHSKWESSIIHDTIFQNEAKDTFKFSKEIWGAELRARQPSKYGRFECRMKGAKGDGVVSSFFTYHAIPDGPLQRPHWNEIDIELIGKNTDTLNLNIFIPGALQDATEEKVPINFLEEFHVYSFEWTPDYISWFLDGKLIRTAKPHFAKALTHPQTIMMNIWPATWKEWGTFSPSSLPTYAIYDYVKYYEYLPATPEKPSSFYLSWTDNFNRFEPSLWKKTLSNTWGSNLCSFNPDNIVYKDGFMILCLTPINTAGYKGGPIKDVKDK